MPTVKDIIVRKPNAEEIAEFETWPTWEKEASVFDWEYTEKETCYVIEGKVRITDNDGGEVSFGAGDLVVFPDDLSCTWHIDEAVVKHYNFG